MIGVDRLGPYTNSCPTVTMICLDLSCTRAAALEVLLSGGEAPSRESATEGPPVQMTFSLPGSPSTTHWLAHVVVPGDAPLEEPRTFAFDEELEQGIVGPVFAGRVGGGPAAAAVVAKVALFAAETRMLLHEAAMYRHLRPLQGRTVPRVYGLFACRTFTVLVLAHCGARVAQIGDFSEGQRCVGIQHCWVFG